MAEPPTRVLAIMGSGETSPTMVTIHKALVARLEPGRRSAVLLDTPYAFQENAADISARAQSYFDRSVGLQVDVVSDVELSSGSCPSADAALAAIRSADWVFVGPGSPSYALTRWSNGAIPGALRDRMAAGSGLTIIASAAAAAMGLLALPVYEIYKVGADPHWLAGLDSLSVLGLKVAVIPHYDNAEGGTHDTRFCYLGERRLALLERQMPQDAAVLGVDEHTALIFDLVTGSVEVVGRGMVTVRKDGLSTALPAGSRTTLPELQTLVRTGPSAAGDPQQPDDRGSRGRRPTEVGGASDLQGRVGAPRLAACEEARDLPEITENAERRFDGAAHERSGAAMVSAILDLESAIEAWSTDTDQNDNSDRARTVLRGLVVRLGQAAEQGLADPADQLRPAIDPLIALRDALRRDGSYAAADVIRDALTAAGVQVHDSPAGTSWALDKVPSSPRQAADQASGSDST